MARSLVVALLFAALAAPASASAAELPNETLVTGPQIETSINAGLEYWSSQGRAPSCPPGGIRTYVADIPATNGLHAAGRARIGGCEIWLDRGWLATLTDPAPLCPVVTHELGHLTGLPDGGTGNPVMDAGILQNVPPIGPCLAAFPPPPPAAQPAATPSQPVITTTPAPTARLTLPALRTQARRVLRGQASRQARPVRCKLSGRRRGACRVERSGYACTGRVYVSLSASGGLTGLADAHCVRSRRRS
jgi:hypothetical protein